ncbi:hypothetical protein GIB67_040521 [Kingdonia uniflora]|uniref:Phytocyanin domain-containing protein n=1 Tax=Kingdonia uniflora TaxID=39325 RepID=A0A7J7L5D8_9MAGN|nr:hypothetical protein GIB67_040521 [Kingdonia uniflora]
MLMGWSKKYVCMFVIFMSLFCSSQAYNFIVGGRDGWVLNPSETYNHWAERNRFQVNDTLIFKYKKGSNSVLVVTKENFDKCNISSPLKSLDDGNSSFKIEKSGPLYFISGNQDNCTKGQKIVIVVLAIRSPPPAPLAPAPGARSPSPSPSSTGGGGNSGTPSPSPSSTGGGGGNSGTPSPSPSPSPSSTGGGGGGGNSGTPSPSPSPSSTGGGGGGGNSGTPSPSPSPSSTGGGGGGGNSGSPSDIVSSPPPKSASPVTKTSFVLVAGVSILVSLILGSFV